jgi:hypothetical protein
VESDAAAADLEAVDDEIVSLRLRRAGSLSSLSMSSSAGAVKGDGSNTSAVLGVPFEQRKVRDPDGA